VAIYTILQPAVSNSPSSPAHFQVIQSGTLEMSSTSPPLCSGPVVLLVENLHTSQSQDRGVGESQLSLAKPRVGFFEPQMTIFHLTILQIFTVSEIGCQCKCQNEHPDDRETSFAGSDHSRGHRTCLYRL
jgi:hypothetical protein